MLKGGVIMDVTNAEEARIAEEAGAVAVMALERVPADIRKDGGIARMSDASVIKAIKAAVTIPVMAKARIGHFVEAQILEALDVDYIDESEVSRGGGEEGPVQLLEVELLSSGLYRETTHMTTRTPTTSRSTDICLTVAVLLLLLV